MKTTLPHKKSYEWLTKLSTNVLLTSLLLLTMWMLSYIVVVVGSWLFSTNFYMLSAIVLGCGFIYTPHYYGHYSAYKIDEKIHGVETRCRQDETSGIWLYVYYIVLGNLWGDKTYFYVRCGVAAVAIATAWFLNRFYNIALPIGDSYGLYSIILGIVAACYLCITDVIMTPSEDERYEQK